VGSGSEAEGSSKASGQEGGVMAGPAAARCSERERLLSHWLDSAKRLRALLEEQLDSLQAVINPGESKAAYFEDQIRLARAGEVDACRKYFGHVNRHECV
jgi:hypothetical protein